MLTEIMRQQKLLTGIWWIPLPATSHEQRTRMLRSQRERQCRTVTYDVISADTRAVRQKSRGLIEQHSLTWEPLALYIRLLYGSGIYHSCNSDGNIWFLIISDGMIVPGTDCLLSRQVFEMLMEGRGFSQYKALPVRELSQACAGEILAHYQTNQRRLRKRRYFFYTALACSGLALLSIPVTLILTG